MKRSFLALVWIAVSRPATRTILWLFSGFPGRDINRSTIVAAGLFVAALGCSRAEVVESPLLDSDQPPLVLVEGRELELPIAGPGNRFVSGWLFDKEAGESIIKPAGGSARLELVQLHSRPRTLALSTVSGTVGPTVTAAIGLRRLEVRTTDSGVEILLPADLAHDRHLVDLEFAEPGAVRLSGAVVSAAAPAGFVRFNGGDVVHHPWSMVDFVRRVDAGVTLVGEFVPPAGAALDQRFAVILDRGDGVLETVFEVRPTALAGEGPLPIRTRLRTTAGLVRIRLLAEGDGPAGRWRGLRLSGRLPQEPTAFTTVLQPPRVVVVYVLDALRADVVDHLGADLGATPCMDSLAAEGAVFADHFSVAPNTGPATKSLFTGFGFLRGRTIPGGGPQTLAEDFAGAGYRTVSVSSNPHLSPSFGLTRGFDEVLFEPLDEVFGEGHAPTVNDSAERVHRAALHWLDGAAAEDRVFLYLHTLNPHNPYAPPPPFPSRFLRTTGSRIDGGTKTLAAIRDRKTEVSPADVQRIREWYTAGVAYNDAALCGLMDELRRRFDDRFLFVVTSDHGEELFDHDGVLHGYTLYDELLHVPLVVWWPERIRPTRIQTATDTLDLTATLRALIGSPQSAAAEDGEALWGLIDGGGGPSSSPALHFATAPGLRRATMVRSGRWKVILVARPRFDWGMGRGRGRTHDAEYVFNLVDDPGESSNLAGTADLEVDWLRLKLRAWTDAWQARQPPTDETLPDEATRRQLEALGYTD